MTFCVSRFNRSAAAESPRSKTRRWTASLICPLNRSKRSVASSILKTSSNTTRWFRISTRFIFPSSCFNTFSEVRLTPTEYDLLKIFVEHRGKIVLHTISGVDYRFQDEQH